MSAAAALEELTPAQAEEQLIEDMARFRHDPLGWVMYAFPWGEGELKNKKGPRKWQVEVLAYIGERLRAGATLEVAFAEAVTIAVASGHGIGKSALIAMIILWAMSTLEDTKGVVTANTEKQLLTKTWPELKKWHRLAINAHWFHCAATSIHSKDPEHEKTWRFDAIPWTEHNSEAFAGLHNAGKRVVLLFDEASAIVDKIWEVAEGALTDALTEIIWIVFGNPTRSSGRFRECFRRWRHRWFNRNIDSRTVEGTNKAQLDKWAADYGEDSDFVKVRVRGEFPSQSLRQYISEDDVNKGFGGHLRQQQYDFAPKIITIDPAWEGGDELVIGMRQGLLYQTLKVLPKNDNDVAVAQVLAKLEDDHQADGVVIDGGFGTGIFSAGQAMKRRRWHLVWFGGGSPDEGCLNMRAYMWMRTRDWLKQGGVIPKDDMLREELTTMEFVERVDGKLQMEPKEAIRERIGRSPNRADALGLSFAVAIQKREVGAVAGSDSVSMNEVEYDPYARGI